ncbi:MAG: GNAT family N-acetyltransferase [Planctomycetia bacterium]|nr:GNAT family N-acetyltransferase [Planctomycetia bacterium]
MKTNSKQPENEFTIRLARREDLPQINDLYEDLIETRSDLAEMEKNLEKIQNDYCNRLLVACRENEVVGTVQCSASRSVAFHCRPFMIVEYFIVKSTFRQHGVGRALLEKAEEIAREYNCSDLLLVSAAKRTIAHELYAKVGYDTTVKGFRKYL